MDDGLVISSSTVVCSSPIPGTCHLPRCTGGDWAAAQTATPPCTHLYKVVLPRVAFSRSLEREESTDSSPSYGNSQGGVRHWFLVLRTLRKRLYKHLPQHFSTFSEPSVPHPVSCRSSCAPVHHALLRARDCGRLAGPTGHHLTFFFSQSCQIPHEGPRYTSWPLHLAPHLQFLLTYKPLNGQSDSNLYAERRTKQCLCLK